MGPWMRNRDWYYFRVSRRKRKRKGTAAAVGVLTKTRQALAITVFMHFMVATCSSFVSSRPLSAIAYVESHLCLLGLSAHSAFFCLAQVLRAETVIPTATDSGRLFTALTITSSATDPLVSTHPRLLKIHLSFLDLTSSFLIISVTAGHFFPPLPLVAFPPFPCF